MKTNKKTSVITLIISLAFLTIMSGCMRDLDELEPATFSTNGEVFIDGFSKGLIYAAFGSSKVTAFDVDKDITYKGTASMRFEVPDFNDPAGSFAGGSYFVADGRDLSGYDALTFWVKASKSATLDVIGFGNDFGESKYKVSLNNLAVNTNWKKVIIPIPDPSLLTQEKGMLFFAEGPENGLGYTFWIDEVQFEKLGTLAHYEPGIMEKQDATVSAQTGQNVTVTGLIETVNLPSAIDQRIEVAPAYFTFTSSNTSVATVNNFGVATVLDAGTAVITARIGELDASGSLTIESVGDPILPPPAPVPTINPNKVLSLYSNAYTNELVDTWDTNWEFTTTETDFVEVDGDDMIRYRNLNFVGIEFTAETKDISNMTHFHMDIWTPDPTALPVAFKVLLVDFGADNTFSGGDDSSHELTFNSPLLVTGSWISIDVPLTNFSGLTGRSNLAQMVLSGNLPNVFVDNVYFYISTVTVANEPTIAAPDPNQEAENVISVFSNVYTNINVADFNPDWGQSGSATQVSIAGNNTLKYANFNYQGTQLAGSQDLSTMEFVHIDMWTANATNLKFTPINQSSEEFSVSLTPIISGQWNSYDIPLSAFTGVSFNDILQLKFDGQAGTTPSKIWLDNIYFYKSPGGEICIPQNPNLTTSFPIDFENCEGLSGVFEDADGVTGFPTENPHQSGINTSARAYQLNKVVGAAWYSGIYHIFPSNYNMTTNKVFKMKVWSPKPNVIVRFQIEKEGNQGPIVTFAHTQTVVNANTWTELTFNFSGDALSGLSAYDKIVIIPDDQNNGPADGSIYYFDDIRLTN